MFVCHDTLRAKKRPTSRVKMLNSHVTVLIDSGASCNVMDKHTFVKDVLRRGVASVASAVSRQHYTGCVDRRTTR